MQPQLPLFYSFQEPLDRFDTGICSFFDAVEKGGRRRSICAD